MATNSPTIERPVSLIPAGTAEKPARKSFTQRLGYDVVKITVGSGDVQKKFQVHKALLCEKAPVFDKIFNGSFIEGQSQSVNLQEDDPEAVQLFISWLYIDIVDNILSINDYQLTPYIRLFGLAEKYCINRLADATMDFITRAYTPYYKLPQISHIEIGYAITHKKSKLRVFLSRCYGYCLVNKAEYADHTGWETTKFLPKGPDAEAIFLDSHKLLRAGKRTNGGTVQLCVEDPTKAPACDYHQHRKGEPCPK